jgi:two-component system, OmpR family, response regulator RegX3
MTTAMTTRAATEVATTTDRKATDRGADGAADGRPVASRAYDSDVIERRRILLVEDERSISGPLAAALEREGFDATVAGTAGEALERAADVTPDLVLLDLMLPDGSGFDVCRELRRTSDVPVVMLTARGDEADRIVGLELGADDYVVKPFSAREVIARVRAVLRRTAAPARGGDDGGTLQIGDVKLDRERRSAALAGDELELSRKEFDLLERLMRDAGTVVTREQLIEDVWDMNWFGSTKTLDVHVSGLRRKLGDDAAEPRYLHTVRGVGFRFSAPSDLTG